MSDSLRDSLAVAVRRVLRSRVPVGVFIELLEQAYVEVAPPSSPSEAASPRSRAPRS